jgi:hypothetical protein
MLFVRSRVCFVVLLMGGCARPEPAVVVSPAVVVAPAGSATPSVPVAAEEAEPFDPTPELGPDGTPTRERLERGHILAGTRGPKAAARERCKSLARAGEVVRIRMIIAGATGTVELAEPAEGQVDSPLAGCVARELRAAVFRRVQKQHTGTTVSVEF